MAQKDVELDQERFSCSICLELLKEPVTLPCGHNYCRNCVEEYWDGEDDGKKVPSCPQCRKSFTPRPVLVKNTMLADLVEQLKKRRLQADPAGAEDVACDSCSGRKLKAVKSCLQCLASYCQEHLQPHHESPTFKNHKLVEPSRRLLENVCSRHNEVMKMFCRSDQKIICFLCSMEEHKDHDTVPAAAERTDRQRALEGSRHNIHQKIQEREKDLNLLQQEVKAISRSADETVEDSQKIFTQMISLLEQRRRDVEQQVRSKQEAEVSRVQELEKKLEQEIRELKRRDAELKKLSDTEDHSQFLQDFPSLSGPSGPTESFRLDLRPPRHFEDVAAAVAELRDQIQEFLKDSWSKISQSVAEVEVLTGPEPTTRAQFLSLSRDLTLDPDTAHVQLLLSEGNRGAALGGRQDYPEHPDRFSYWQQVLSGQGLTGRCYWEVEWSGPGLAYVSAAYRSIGRTGTSNQSRFGFNARSWALSYYNHSYNLWADKVHTAVPGPRCSRVGVYLDHGAGVLAFYSVSAEQTMTLIHRVQTRFTQPLHPGLWLCLHGTTARFCQPD